MLKLALPTACAAAACAAAAIAGDVPCADLDGDNVVTSTDLNLVLGQFGDECEDVTPGPVVIESFFPQAAQAGQLITLLGSNFPDDLADTCVVVANGCIFDILEVSANGTLMKITPVAIPPNAKPGPLMIGIGEGASDVLPSPLPSFIIPVGETSMWIGDPGNPDNNFETEENFVPIPNAPGGGESTVDQTAFGNVVSGEIEIDLAGISANAGDRISIFVRAWCEARMPDINFDLQQAVVDMDADVLADVICVLIESTFNNPPGGLAPIPEIECEGDGSIIRISYTDCPIFDFVPQAVIKIQR